MTTYRVVIEGNTLPGFALEDVCQRLAVLTRCSAEVAAKLLAGRPSDVKRGVDHATGLRYVEAMRQVGVACRLEQETLEIDLEPRASTPAEERRSKGPGEVFCTECGAVIKEKAEICPNCGVRQLPGPTAYSASSVAQTSGTIPTGGRSRIAAALFALLLGGLGIHKFYLGKVGQGILYLLFCWTFIPALIGFIEGIVYLSTSDAEFARKYG